MTKQEIRDEEIQLNARYGDLLNEVAAIMFRHDTEGLARMGCPTDEYMPEARRVLLKLEETHDLNEMRQLVKTVYKEMFEEALDATDEQLNALSDELWTHVSARTA